jgi:hypothetical protein
MEEDAALRERPPEIGDGEEAAVLVVGGHDAGE